jgi:hypothetical protein
MAKATLTESIATQAVWSQKDRWEHAYTRLTEYKAHEGHADVPARYRDTDGFRLGQWLWSTRIEARKGRLTEEREIRLTNLGVKWEGRRAHLGRMIDSVDEYAKQMGSDNVAYLIGDVLMREGIAVPAALRRAYREDKLDPDQISHLEELGFCWDASDAWFAHGVAEMTEYRDAGNAGKVSSRYVSPSGMYLGDWCRRQVTAVDEGESSPERVTILRSLGVL